MSTTWEVTVPVTIALTAESREEAIATALGWIEADLSNVEHVGEPRVKHLWHDRAEQLLKDGASYREVADTIRVDRGRIAKVLPGYGMTKQQGIEVRNANRLLNQTAPLGLSLNGKKSTTPTWAGPA